MGLFDRFFAPNVSKLEGRGDIEGISALVTSEYTQELRISAIGALSRIGGTEISEVLADALSDSDFLIAKEAEKVLIDLGTASAGVVAGALGGRGGDAALSILVNFGEEIAGLLANSCKDKDDDVRRRAFKGLVLINDGSSAPEIKETLFRALLAALGDRVPENRVFAATNLQKLGDPKAGRGLASHLKDGDEGVREACRRALSAIGEPAVPFLLDALADRNANSRKTAAELLGKVCQGNVAPSCRRVALEALAERASDSDAGIAAAARLALENIPSEEIIENQVELLADPDRSDLEDIREFLDRILIHGGLRPGFKARISERIKVIESRSDDSP